MNLFKILILLLSSQLVVQTQILLVELPLRKVVPLVEALVPRLVVFQEISLLVVPLVEVTHRLVVLWVEPQSLVVRVWVKA
jgi:hypothetical protein